MLRHQKETDFGIDPQQFQQELERLKDLEASVSSETGDFAEPFLQFLEEFRADTTNYLAELKNADKSALRRQLNQHYIMVTYRVFRSEVNSLFSSMITSFISVVKQVYSHPPEGARSDGTYRQNYRTLLTFRKQDATTKIDIRAAVTALNKICQLSPDRQPPASLVSKMSAIATVYENYLTAQEDFEAYLYGDYGLPALPSLKFMFQFPPPSPVLTQVRPVPKVPNRDPSPAPKKEIEAKQRVIEAKKKQLAELKKSQSPKPNLANLEARRKALVSERARLEKRISEQVDRHQREKTARMPEWENLTNFVQLLSDFSIQTIEMLTGKRNTFRIADYEECKKYLILEFESEGPVTRETLGPIIAKLDRLQR